MLVGRGRVLLGSNPLDKSYVPPLAKNDFPSHSSTILEMTHIHRNADPSVEVNI